MTIESLAQQGKTEDYSTLAGGITKRIFDLRKEVIKESMSDFQNFEHRLEFVLRVHGVDFINDSRATNVNATWYALETISHPVIWIAGGMDKNNNYKAIKELVREKVKVLICLGKDNNKLIKYFSKIIPDIIETSTMVDAVNAAYSYGEINDVVLLSPTCPSFALFENYEDRGKQFKQAVYNL